MLEVIFAFLNLASNPAKKILSHWHHCSWVYSVLLACPFAIASVIMSWSAEVCLLDAFQKSGSQIQYFLHALAHLHISAAVSPYVPSCVPGSFTGHCKQVRISLSSSRKHMVHKEICFLLNPPSSYFVVSAQSQLLLTFLIYFTYQKY